MADAAILFGANVTKATPELLDILRFEMKLARVLRIFFAKNKFDIKKIEFLIFSFDLDFNDQC